MATFKELAEDYSSAANCRPVSSYQGSRGKKMSEKKVKKTVALIESVDALQRMVAQMQQTLTSIKSTLKSEQAAGSSAKPKSTQQKK